MMQRYFEYLDALRASGVTNMFGAVPYLEEEFRSAQGRGLEGPVGVDADVRQGRQVPGCARSNGDAMMMTPQRISELFVQAFDKGEATYWCRWPKLVRADNAPTTSYWYADPAVFAGSFEAVLEYDLRYEDDNAGRKAITQDDVRRALDVMARKYPKQHAGDEHTADTLVQVLVHGYAIYGYWLDDWVEPWKRGMSPEALAHHEEMLAKRMKVVEQARRDKSRA